MLALSICNHANTKFTMALSRAVAFGPFKAQSVYGEGAINKVSNQLFRLRR